MADKDDALSFPRKLLHDLEKAFHFLIRKRRRRLIENQHITSAVQCFQDLYPLLGSNRQFRDRLVEIRDKSITL